MLQRGFITLVAAKAVSYFGSMFKKAPIWQLAPFLRLLPPFVAGILLNDKSAIPIFCHWAMLATSLLLLLLMQWKRLAPSHRFRWVVGMPVYCLLAALGAISIHYAQVRNNSGWFGHRLSNGIAVIGSPESLPLPGPKTLRVVFKVSQMIMNNGERREATGRIQVYYTPGALSDPSPGETWMLSLQPVAVTPAIQHPGAFNYSRYAARQQLFHQGFFKPTQLKRIRPAGRFSIPAFFAIGQRSAIAAIRTSVPLTEQGVAMALLVGYRQEIDKELLQVYNDTGVVHVIAVSGMHLGLIFLLLQQLLRFPEHQPVFRWLKAAAVLWVICWFSGVAGAAPSILRAAIMFGFALLGKLIFRQPHTYQSLSLSAFGMLVINPNWCWDAGFQLSFAALTSIVLYQPLISTWLKPSNKLLLLLWELTAVTLAAQLLTFPLSVALFHQAPIYFLGANLIAVPLSSIALITGLLQWACSAIDLPLTLPGQLTGLLIQLMNTGIAHFRQLPGSVLSQLEWSFPTVLMAYGMIVSISLYLIHRKVPYLLATACCGLLSAFISLTEKWTLSQQSRLLIYQIPKSRAVDYFCSGTQYEFGQDSLTQTLRKSSQRFFRIHNRKNLNSQLFRAGPYRIAICNRYAEARKLLSFHPDIFLLPKGTERVDGFLSFCQPGTLLVADGTMPAYQASILEAACKQREIAFHNGWEKGPLLISFDNKRTFAPP